MWNIASAQQIELKGEFEEQQTKIGEEIIYSLSARYDKNINVLFPDSTFNFAPFEYNSRTYFQTKTDSTQSFDSVVYNLSTFEIDSVQYLQLPVFIINNKDSIKVFPESASIRLDEIITEIPEKPDLKANAEFVKIQKQFNYPYLLIGLGIFCVLVLTLALFFGKQLATAWQMYRLKKIHEKFMAQFTDMIRNIGENARNTPEQVLIVWKNYIERLEKKPITKLTTKEILVLHNDGQLKNSLKLIDRSIYGGEKENDLLVGFDYLKKFSVEIYDQKITEIKNR